MECVVQSSSSKCGMDGLGVPHLKSPCCIQSLRRGKQAGREGGYLMGGEDSEGEGLDTYAECGRWDS
jgi:hypothetical protein